MVHHPIFGELNEDAKQKRLQEAAVLKKMMEELWQSKRVVNAHRPARYVKPMSMGSDWGYEKEFFSW